MSPPVSVVKIGTSSITRPSGELDEAALVKLADDLAAARAAGRRVVLVMSGAIAAGMPALGLTSRPTDIGTLQAIAAVGQPRLLERMSALLGKHDVVAGQVLLTPYDFLHRSQYLHARVTLQHLLDLGVLPIVNENDTVADDEIRYGDNDRLAALVSHMLGADVLLMLTDTAGVFTADPRRDDGGVADRGDRRGRRRARAGRGRRGHRAGKRRHGEQARGGQDRGVVGRARGDRVGRAPRRRDRRAGRSPGRHVVRAARAAAGEPQAVDRVRARRRKARSSSTPARGARSSRAASRCLPAGVRDVEGDFDADATVEIVDDDGAVFAKGLCRYTSQQLR